MNLSYNLYIMFKIIDTYLLRFIRETFVYKGRVSRNEFWNFYFLNIFIMVFFTMFGILGVAFDKQNEVEILFEILSIPFVIFFIWSYLLTGISVSIRRLHDVGRSGWWLLLNFVPIFGPIILFIFYCLGSQENTNKWGERVDINKKENKFGIIGLIVFFVAIPILGILAGILFVAIDPKSKIENKEKIENIYIDNEYEKDDILRLGVYDSPVEKILKIIKEELGVVLGNNTQKQIVDADYLYINPQDPLIVLLKEDIIENDNIIILNLMIDSSMDHQKIEYRENKVVSFISKLIPEKYDKKKQFEQLFINGYLDYSNFGIYIQYRDEIFGIIIKKDILE